MRPISLMLISFLLFSFTSLKTNRVSMPGDWQFIGDKKVSFGVDHDVLLFADLNDDFRQLKLRISDGPLKMYNMKVHFDNGNVQDIAIRTRIQQGDESWVKDLDEGRRHLNKNEFWYETKGFLRGKARVDVWGRK